MEAEMEAVPVAILIKAWVNLITFLIPIIKVLVINADGDLE